MSNAAFKAKVASVNALRVAAEDVLVPGLRKALRDRSNYIIAKAAAIASERYALTLIPDLLAAYDRLFDDEPNVDPLALGKNAIAKALKDLDCRDADVFLRGLHHVQLEGAWGKPVDAAAGLRGTCALALVGCDIDDVRLLCDFIDHLITDKEKSVRVDVARAIAEVGGEQSMLLLRSKALAGDAEPEVLGACFTALISRESRESVAFVERFLENQNVDIRFEAICALAMSRESSAQAAVRRFWGTPLPLDVRRAIIFSCAESAAPEVPTFLLSLIADPQPELGAWALTALATSRFRAQYAERARQVVDGTGDAKLLTAFTTAFSPA